LILVACWNSPRAAARAFGMQAVLFRNTSQAIADIQARLQADGAR
jgi:hypothetical protein